MRLNPSLLAAALVLTALTACGTKTPLSLPTPTPTAAQATVTPAPTPAIDNTNKAAAETRP